MKKNDVEELKEFIQSTVYEAISESESRMTNKMIGLVGELRTEMNAGFAGVAEAIDYLRTDLDAYQVRTDKRLTRLERKVFYS